MKNYINPTIKITKFETENILTVSGDSPTIDGGSTGFKDSWVTSAIDNGGNWSEPVENVLEYR